MHEFGVTLESGCGEEEAEESSRGESFRRLASDNEPSFSEGLSYNTHSLSILFIHITNVESHPLSLLCIFVLYRLIIWFSLSVGEMEDTL